jgi:hypothetical protein
LDDLLLELAGVESETKREDLSQIFRKVALAAIDALRRTMARGFKVKRKKTESIAVRFPCTRVGFS